MAGGGGAWLVARGEECGRGLCTPRCPSVSVLGEVTALGSCWDDGASHGGGVQASPPLLHHHSQAKILLWRSWLVSRSKPLQELQAPKKWLFSKCQTSCCCSVKFREGEGKKKN